MRYVKVLIVPILTLLILAGAIWGLVALTQKIGENLEPMKPRVIVFGATWCGYCPRPADVQKLRDDFPGVEVEHYDVDKDKEVARHYRIRSLPTFIVCSDKGCQVFHTMLALRAYLEGEVGLDHSVKVNDAS